MVGLGLAIAQPDRPVLVVTGDGEMLMGLGALATIGVQRPPNLAIVVFDNGHYGETGMQPSHTESGVDWSASRAPAASRRSSTSATKSALRDFAAGSANRRDPVRPRRDPRRRAAARAAAARRGAVKDRLPPRNRR